MKVLVIFSKFAILAIFSNLSSGTETIPIFGEIVVKGKAAISTLFLVRALNKVDFPTLGRPTIPIEKDILYVKIKKYENQ